MVTRCPICSRARAGTRPGSRFWSFAIAAASNLSKSWPRTSHRLNPQATVDFNYHGNPPFSFEVGQRPVQHAGNGDFVTGETGVWGFSALGVGLNAEFYRAATPGLPFQVAMQRGVRFYHDQTTRPLADIRWELFTLLAHGAFVTIIDKTGFDGGLDPVAYQRVGTAFAEARAKRAHFGHSPVYEAGIYFSARSRDWLGRDDPGEWQQSFLGAHKALTYEHISCGVVLDENVSAETLRRYPVIILANIGILSDREIALLRTYVEEGGGLIVTGHSGAFDLFGRPSPSAPLASLIGATAEGRLDSLDNWVRFPATPAKDAAALSVIGPVRPDWPFLLKGPATRYAPQAAQAFGELLRPYRSTRQSEGKESTSWPMSAESVVGPAVLLNRVGKGQVLTFAGSPDWATASEHHITEARQLLASAVRFLNPHPRVRVEAPTNIETVITDDAATRTLRIHFLGYNSPPQSIPAGARPFVMPALIETAPLFRAKVTLTDAPKSVSAFNPTTQLDQQANQVFQATIEDVHEVILVRY